MSFESDLYAVLDAVAPDKVFPDFADVGTPRPYVTWQRIGGSLISPVSNEAPNRRNAAVQINVWSDTRAESLSLSRAIEMAMRAATTFNARPAGEIVADYDADIPVYGSLQEFSCWYSE